MQTIDVKCNGKSARENRGLSIVRFSLGLHFTQIASCLPVSLIWLYLAIKKSLIWLVNPQKPIFAKSFLLFQILMLENPSLKNFFFLLHMLMLENTLFRKEFFFFRFWSFGWITMTRLCSSDSIKVGRAVFVKENQLSDLRGG